jgi:cell division protein FtsB
MRSLWKHPFTILVIFVLAVGFWISLWANSREIRQSLGIVSQLEGQIDTAEHVNQILKERLEQSKSAEAQEVMIRNELVMQKPGEYVVQLPDLPLPSPTVITPPSHPSPWQQWRQLLQ